MPAKSVTHPSLEIEVTGPVMLWAGWALTDDAVPVETAGQPGPDGDVRAWPSGRVASRLLKAKWKMTTWPRVAVSTPNKRPSGMPGGAKVKLIESGPSGQNTPSGEVRYTTVLDVG